MTQGKFTSLVETRVKESQGLINYIEAVTSVCEEFEIVLYYKNFQFFSHFISFSLSCYPPW